MKLVSVFFNEKQVPKPDGNEGETVTRTYADVHYRRKTSYPQWKEEVSGVFTITVFEYDGKTMEELIGLIKARQVKEYDKK